MSDDSTSIQIGRETWRRLNGRKRGPDETFDDVLQRLLDETED
jgi:predicted CopG family antitoxin